MALALRISTMSLEFQHHTLSEKILANLVELVIPSYTSKGNFKMDAGTTNTIDWNFTRVHPVDWVPQDDEQYQDSTKWSNNMWHRILVSAFVDRWQYRTDGCRFSYQSDNGYFPPIEENCYIIKCDVKYTENTNGAITGYINVGIGSSFTSFAPPRPSNARTITYICDGDDTFQNDSMVQDVRSGMTVALKGLPPIWETSKAGWTAFGWAETRGGPTKYAFGEEIMMGDEDMTLYVAWYRTITIYANGSCPNVAQTFNVQTSFTFPPLPSAWTGCGEIFAGYGLSSGTNIISYRPGDTITITSSTPLVYYSLWASTKAVYVFQTPGADVLNIGSISSFAGLTVYMQAGGGGGANNDHQFDFAGGGGGGGQFRKFVVKDVRSSYQLYVGAGGASYVNGGNSSFGTPSDPFYTIATGGFAGQWVSIGPPPLPEAPVGGPGGYGGYGLGDIVQNGGKGGDGAMGLGLNSHGGDGESVGGGVGGAKGLGGTNYGVPSDAGGGGGGSGTSTVLSAYGINIISTGGQGGGQNDNTGHPGGSGGGGGGAGATSGTTAWSGGAGGNGYIVVLVHGM